VFCCMFIPVYAASLHIGDLPYRSGDSRHCLGS
jgi:hypothetical protein